jgi:hypothetical protein
MIAGFPRCSRSTLNPCHCITTVLPHQTSLRSPRTMMTRANSLHPREAGSLISLPVTHDHDPHKHPRTGATVMTAVVGYGGRTRRN